MKAASFADLHLSRARASRALRPSRRYALLGPKATSLHVEVRRSPSGAPYIDTLSQPKEASQRVFLSEGASTLFWGVHTYRLVWLDH